MPPRSTGSDRQALAGIALNADWSRDWVELSAGEASDRRGRAVSRYDLGEQDLATDRLHEISADDLVEPIIVALDEELRLDLADELHWGVLLEDNDQIDSSERGQHRRALGFALNRTPRPFEPPGRCVAVQTDDKPVARRFGLPEQCHVPGV